MNYHRVGVAVVSILVGFLIAPQGAYADITRVDSASVGFGFYARDLYLNIQAGDLIVFACRSYTGYSNGTVGTSYPVPGDQFYSRYPDIRINGHQGRGFLRFAFLGMQSEGNGGVDVWSTVAPETGIADVHIPPMMDADHYGDACSAVAYRGANSDSPHFTVSLMTAPPSLLAATSTGSWLLWVNPYGASSTPPTAAMQHLDATSTGANILQDSNGAISTGTYHAPGVLMEIKSSAPPPLTPVIIIPGILGSAQHNGEWLIDPITHTYDNLIDTLAVNGYEKEKNLFTFPYDWHLSNRTTATLLKQKIDEVKSICECDKIDIVAHSMGGLVARQYIQSSAYDHDIRKLVFLGTPQLGSPKSYLMWEGGETETDFKSKVLRNILKVEARKRGYTSLFDYERQFPIPSVQELLPVYGYIKHVGSLDIPAFPNSQWYPGNLFLGELNSNIAALYDSGVTISNFVGQLAGDTTITTIRVVPPAIINPTVLWGFGVPENFGNNSTDQGLERGVGDGTVPLTSAGFVTNDLNIVDSEHNDLSTKTEGQIFEKLTGDDATTLINNSHGLFDTIKNILIFQILSPADIVIIDPDGFRVGKNFSTGQDFDEIPDAFYSGFGTDEEYVTIPNPKNGIYKILTQGTGSGGEYTLVTGIITGSTSTETFFSGQTLSNLITEHDVNVDTNNPGETEIIPTDQTPPTISIVQPATTTYTHSDFVPVRITFSDDTGVATSSVIFDTAPISASSTVDLFFRSLGAHTLVASATDLVNNATTSTTTIQVIATYDSTVSDINRAFNLGWILKKDVKNNLLKKLHKAVTLEKKIDTIVVSTKPRVEKKVERLEKKIDKVLLRALARDVQQAYVKRKINDQAYQLLADDLNWLINH